MSVLVLNTEGMTLPYIVARKAGVRITCGLWNGSRVGFIVIDSSQSKFVGC